MAHTLTTHTKPAASSPAASPYRASLRWRIADLCVKWGVYGALSIAVAFFSVAYPDKFLTHTNIAEGIGSAVAVTAILSVGLTIALAAGQVDISGGAMMALSSFAFVAFVEHTNRGGELFHARASLPVAVLIGLAVALVVAIVNGILVVNLGIYSLLATFPTAVLCVAIASAFSQPQGGNYYLVPHSRNWGFVLAPNALIFGVPVAVVIAGIVVVLGWLLLERTRFGCHIQATGGNPSAALRAGIPVNRVYRYVFLISAVTAVIAAYVAMSSTEFGGPNLGVTAAGVSGAGGLSGASFDALTAVLIGGAAIGGGAARIERTIVGALLVGVLGDGLQLTTVNIFLRGVVVGCVFVLAVMLSSIASKRQTR